MLFGQKIPVFDPIIPFSKEQGNRGFALKGRMPQKLTFTMDLENGRENGGNLREKQGTETIWP
jgi:hypothetical protein